MPSSHASRAQPQVERRIVDQNHCVGQSALYQPRGHLHVAAYGAEIAEYFAEAHVGHVAVVDRRLCTGSLSHEVAAEEAEPRVAGRAFVALRSAARRAGSPDASPAEMKYSMCAWSGFGQRLVGDRGETFGYGAEYVVDRAGAGYGVIFLFGGVEVAQGRCEAVVHLESLFDGLGIVVAASRYFAALDQALYQFFVGNFEARPPRGLRYRGPRASCSEPRPAG